MAANVRLHRRGGVNHLPSILHIPTAFASVTNIFHASNMGHTLMRIWLKLGTLVSDSGWELCLYVGVKTLVVHLYAF